MWKPWWLKVADHVEEKGDTLLIRRGGVEVSVPYAGVLTHKFIRIGSSSGVQLTFLTPKTHLVRRLGSTWKWVLVLLRYQVMTLANTWKGS